MSSLFRALSFTVFVAALGCGSEPPGRPQLDAERVDFGAVLVGRTAARTVELSNAGLGVLALEAPNLEPASPDFSFEFEADRLAPGASTPLTVRFTPAGLGEVESVLRLSSSGAEDLALGLLLRGQGVDPSVLRVDGELAFGNVLVGAQSRRAVTVTNAADHALLVALESSAIVHPCASPAAEDTPLCFALQGATLEPDGRFVLEAGASAQLEVTFEPFEYGLSSGHLTLRACDDLACAIEVPITGVGFSQGLLCDPPNVDFGGVNPGDCVTRAVRCENRVDALVTVVGWGASANPPTSPDFRFVPSAPVVLETGEAFDVDVTYCPSALGNDDGNLQIETDLPAPSRFLQVGLTGYGGGPDLELAGNGCAFGEVSLLAPARCTALLTNVGFDDVEITSVLPDVAGTGAFTAPGAGAAVIPPGGSYAITIEFQPVAVGPVTSAIRVTSNDVGAPDLDIPVSGTGVDLPSCQFDLRPAALDFGVVTVGQRAFRGFEVRNTGPHDCLVTSVRLEPGTDPELALSAGPPLLRRLAPGAAAVLGVEYTPTTVGTHGGAVEVSISSATSTFNRVPLAGTGADASLLVAPSDIDFGAVGLGCRAAARTVRVFNPTSTPATLTEVAWQSSGGPTSGAFARTAPALPLDLAPGDEASLTVTFTASAAAPSQYVDALRIAGRLGGAPVIHFVSARGEGALAPVQEQRFVQGGAGEVDVLFVLDETASMEDEQVRLTAAAEALFFSGLLGPLDYQVGVTSADAGRRGGRLFHSDRPRGNVFGGPFGNRIVIPRTRPDPVTVFGMNVQPPILPSGATSAAGMHAAYLALTPPVLTGHNAGFLRPNAALAVVFVSDEDDLSTPLHGAPSDDVEFYMNALYALKGFRNLDLVTVSALVGDLPAGCRGPVDAAQAAPRYTELARRTGGLVRSICAADWQGALEDIAAHAAGLRIEIELRSTPVAGSLEVSVDGVSVPATDASGQVTWTYDPSTNAVRFDAAAVPPAGAEVVVRYTPECL